MTELYFSRRFQYDLASIYSEKLTARIYNFLDLLRVSPELGTRDFPESLRERFSGDIRKIAIPPFDLIYTYDSNSEIVYVEALVLMRSVQ